MNYLVKDISTLDTETEFRNDVQLSDYRSAKNLELLKSYMFTAGSFPNKKSTFELLDTLYRAVADRLDNRFLIQATYGHGKSHFGLALANFFGKAEGSLEIDTLLQKVGRVVKDAAAVGNFRSFKRNRKPFLVVMLRGDMPGNLRDKFFRGLDEAFKEHETTKDTRPPLWFASAIDYIDSLKGEQVKAAESFLEGHRLDLAGLRRRLGERESELYDLCVGLCRSVSNVTPDFGGEASLSDTIDWVVGDLCGKDKPFGGLLVLFDEFSEFVSEYKRRQATGVHLQELMNGVSNHAGDVLFVAFSQHEPESIARDDGSPEAAGFLKELNRIPKRFRLHSSLEDVLGAYFRIEDANWQELMRQPKLGVRIAEASDMAYEAFTNRYRQVLHWSTEEFQERVTKECFPLHPLTTALLSSVEFEAAATTRSVLKFLTDPEGEVKWQLEEPAVVNDAVNWVLPTSLVDYFEEMLGAQVWQQYKNVSVPDLTDVQRAILKGMVLQIAGNIPTKQIGFENLIGQLTGYSQAEAKAALVSLEEARYIRRDEANRAYSFWSGSNGAIELERLLNQKREELTKRGRLSDYLDALDGESTNEVNSLLNKTKLLQTYPVDVAWGHPEDWAAQEFVLTKAAFSYGNLERLLGRCQATLTHYPDCRGLVLMPIAETQEEVNWFREELERVLDTSANLKSAPLTVLRPQIPTPDLKWLLIKYAVMYDKKFKDEAIHQIGNQVLEEEKTRFEKQIRAGLEQLRSESVIEVPQEARGAVKALSLTQGSGGRIPKVLKEVYRVVYHKAPPAWFTQYKHSSGNNMRNAVSVLATVLVSNNMANARAGLSAVASETVNQFVEGSWGMLSPQNQLQQPTSEPVKEAWRRLDGAFSVGDRTPIRRVLAPLLNAPFGYDYNTLTVLFCGWFGFNRRDSDIVMNGSFIAINDDFVTLGKGKGNLKPSDFLGALDEAKLYRRDPSKHINKIEEVISSVENGSLRKDRAESLTSELRQFQTKFKDSETKLLERVEQAQRKLDTGLSTLTAYEHAVSQVQSTLPKAKTVSDLAAQLKKVGELQVPYTIISELPKPEELRDQIQSQIRSMTAAQCEANEALRRLTDYGKQEEALKQMRAELNRSGLSSAAGRVDEALAKLERERGRLEGERQESQHLDTINQVAVSAGLKDLKRSEEALKQFVETGSERVKAKASAKLADVQARIDRLKSFVVKLPANLDAVRSTSEAKQIHDQILAERAKYEDTPDYNDIETDQWRSEKLEAFFVVLERNVAPASRQDSLERLEALAGLPEQFSDSLHESQRTLLENAVKQTRKYVEEKEREAQAWLEELEAALEGSGKLDAIERELNTPHLFLTEDLHGQLASLRRKLRQHQSAKEQEEQTLIAIAGAAHVGTLEQLRASLKYLAQFSETTQSVKEALVSKRGKIDASLRSLMDRVSEWQAELEQTTSAQEAEELERSIFKHLSDYRDSELYEQVELLHGRAQTTVEVLQELKKRPTLESYDTFRKRLEHLQALRETQGLTRIHQEAIQRAVQDVKSQLEKREQQASRWLSDLEEQVSLNENPHKLRSALQNIPTFLPTSEQTRFTALEAKVRRLEEKLEQDREIQRRLQSLTPSNTYHDYQKQLNALTELESQAHEQKLKTAISERIGQAKARILREEERLEQVIRALGEVESTREVRKLLSTLSDLQSFFGQSDAAVKIDGFVKRAESLEKYLNSLTSYEGITLQDPTDFEEHQDNIRQLIKMNQHYLSSPQVVLGEKQLERLYRDLQGKQEEACRWLRSCQQELDGADEVSLPHLEEKLKTPHKFLPKTEAGTLETLRQKVEARIGENETYSILLRFKRIKDPKKRQACFTKLEALMRELESAS